MDVLREEVRNLNYNEFTETKSLEHASQQARQRNYQDFLIVDVDSHHYENEHYKEVYSYIESPVMKHEAMESMARGGRSAFLNSQVGYQGLSGRITRHNLRKQYKHASADKHRDIAMTKEWMDAMGVDYACLFPTPMLFLGLHPQVEVETALCRAYNRWLCERILAHEPRIVSMLYLPFNDPDAAYKTVKDFGDKKGVVGFMVTSPRYKPVHDNAYMKTYALLEEIGKPISFHAAYSWDDRALQMTNRFISVHSLGFMWFNMIHMTNWVINGLPERFPKLPVLWIESGLTWAYCLMQRLDHCYMMRTSDCPSLKRKPIRIHARDVLFVAADGDSGRPVDPGGDLQDDQGRDPAGVVVRLSALGLRPAVERLRPAVPQGDGQAQHPRRQCGEAVQARHQAGEEDSLRTVARMERSEIRDFPRAQNSRIALRSMRATLAEASDRAPRHCSLRSFPRKRESSSS